MPTSINVFVSYSHKDAELKDQLLDHLSSLSHEGLIKVWHDRQIDAGDYWVASIDNHLEVSSIILLLVTPSFMASDYCYGVELDRALQRGAAGEARVIPVILRPTDWRNSKFGALQALPTDGEPITAWPNADEAFLDVAHGLRSVILKSQSPPQGVAPLQHADDSRTTRSSAVRYYLYISDSKVNMLFPQTPRNLKEEVARDLDFPFSDGSRNHSAAGSEGERIFRLETVIRFIRQRCEVGTIDEPKDYIAGTSDLQWGHLHNNLMPRSGRDRLVFFNGWTEQTTLLMCGSSRHLVGNLKPTGGGFSSSSLPHVIESLMNDIEVEEKPISSLTADGRIASHEKEELPYVGNELALALVDNASGHMSGAYQKVEFVARTLLHGPSHYPGRHCLLASPLYVSLVF